MLKRTGRKYPKNTVSLACLKEFEPLIKTARVVNLGGRTGPGEPLLAKNFEETIREIRRINPRAVIDLTTNGSLLTDEITQMLVSVAPVAITFSMHGATTESYSDVMNTKPEMFEKVVNNITNFCNQARGKQIQTNINFGFGRKNYQDTEDVITWAAQTGISSVTVFPYYKSPNSFMEDVSLYDDIDLANETLRKSYELAKRLKVQLIPPEPNFLKEREEAKLNAVEYVGGCQEPLASFLMKGDMYHKDKAGFCVCNRIMISHVDLSKVTSDDLYWMWYHPVANSLRLPNPRKLPPICKFCKDPETPIIRTLDHEEYKKRRDQACIDTLAPYQTEELQSSPTGAITLLDKNVFSVDYQFADLLEGQEDEG